MKTVRMLAACALPALAAASFAAAAQDVTLRIHHFLPPGATIQQKVFLPWCDKIGKESGGRLKCQIYPAMQLGGTPPQLFDQARDGVADVVWTLPTYQAGRFPKSEVFELPFMAKSAETGSPAVWEYVQNNAQDEFRGVKLLAAHLHDGSLFHFAGKQVKTMDDMKGLKVRAPTRIGTKFLAALGVTPVQMPLPQVPESISKGVIDGAMVPWEGTPPIKLHDSLPPDLKKVIDANSGLDWSKQIGIAFDATTEPARKLAAAAGGVFDTLSASEYDRWLKATDPVNKEWVTDVSAKGANGQALLDDAKALIRKHGG
jgi:TRAP-type C4-dicarboxylate transport system substrate-binding protein